ncbi:MAG: hypothetical protein AAF581_21125 [Planctomycetota bacterium]
MNDPATVRTTTGNGKSARTVARLLLRMQFAGGACLAALWLWTMPHGFPLDHWRCWANSILPVPVLLVCTWSLWMLWQRREPRLQSVQLAVATFLTVALVTGSD